MSNPEDTKKRLLQATLELISTRGYQGATTREIAKRAGVSELTLFRKFGNKENLFEEMIKRYTFLPRLKDMVQTIEDLNPEEALCAIGIRFIETLKERKDFVRVVMSEINTFPEHAREAYGKVIQEMGKTLEGYLKNLDKRGLLRTVPLDTAAVSFLRILFTTFLNEEILWGREMSEKNVGKTVRQIVDILLNGILANQNEIP